MKKYLLAIIVAAFSLFSITTSVSAQSCGDLYTVGNCYEAGGCSAGSMCKADGPWPWHWNFRCETDSRCAAPIQPAINTTADCGLERTVNGVTGCFADDNGLIQNGLSCQAGGGLCCRTAASCPAPTTEPAGCGYLTNGGATCQVDGRATGSFQRCGQTQACCTTGITCPQLPTLNCGEQTEFSDQSCNCETGLEELPNGNFCCGWEDNGNCRMSDPAKLNDPDPDVPGGGGNPTNPTNPTNPGGGTGGGIDIFEGPTSANFRELNPLNMFGSATSRTLNSPGAIVSRLLTFAFPLAGLILFVMIVWGGFEMLTGATGKGIEAGRQRVTAALVGFTLLFVAYWVFQIVEVIFGVVIL